MTPTTSSTNATQQMREALLSGKVHHTRYRTEFGGAIYAYFTCPDSPTGVQGCVSLPVAEFDALWKELTDAGLVSRTLSPLSPTEGHR